MKTMLVTIALLLSSLASAQALKIHATGRCDLPGGLTGLDVTVPMQATELTAPSGEIIVKCKGKVPVGNEPERLFVP